MAIITKAFYIDDNHQCLTRDQWIEVYEYQLQTGMFKDHLDIIAPEGVHKKSVEMFEDLLKCKDLIFYGLVEVEEFSDDEIYVDV